MSSTRRTAGFTIPELLVAITIVGVLALASFFILRPDAKDVQRRNAERQLDVAMLAQVIATYHQKVGKMPDGITTTPKVIGSQEGELNLCSELVPKYMTDIPLDPLMGDAQTTEPCNAEDQVYTSAYTIAYNKNKTAIIIAAPHAEDGQTITLTKQL